MNPKKGLHNTTFSAQLPVTPFKERFHENEKIQEINLILIYSVVSLNFRLYM